MLFLHLFGIMSPVYAYFICLRKAIRYSSSSPYWRTGLGLSLDSSIYQPQRNSSFVLAATVAKSHDARTFEFHCVFSIPP